MSLEGTVALVTGSDSGIGQAVAVAFAREGADVAINYNRDDEGANRTREQVESTGRKALLVKTDLRDPETIPAMFERIRSELGPVDVLVNNAGTGGGGGLTETDLEQWETVINTNLRGSWLCSKEAARDMRAKGWGRIVNISSVAGKKPGGVYNVSKAAIDMLTTSLAQELTSEGINVNAISPGLIYTDMTRDNLDEEGKMAEAAQDIPVGRVGDVMDIANMVLYMVSDKADFMSGANVVIDGGSLQQG